MRSVTFLVAGLFSIYSIQPPEARAGQSKPATLQEALEQTLNVLSDAKLEVLDGEGKALDPESFHRSPPKEISMLSSDEDGNTLKFSAKLGDLKKGPAYTLVVSDPDTGKVVSRRMFVANAKDKDVEGVKLRFKQTARSVENDIARHFGPKETGQNTLKQIKHALVSLFGIPSAHARISADAFAGLSFAIGIVALIAMGMLLGWAANPVMSEVQSSLVKGGIAVAVIATSGLVTAFVLGFCSEELESIIRTARGK